jgi:hypothetical protein
MLGDYLNFQKTVCFGSIFFNKKFQNQRTVCVNFFSISKSENCQFQFFEKKIRIKQPTILAI